MINFLRKGESPTGGVSSEAFGVREEEVSLNKKIIQDRVLGAVALTVWIACVGLYAKYPTKHPPYPPAEALEESGHYVEAENARKRLAEQRGEPVPNPRVHRDGDWQRAGQD